MRALSLLAGLILAAICLAGLRIDILNNFQYGSTVSHELASVLVLAAIGVATLPAIAGFRGWGWLYLLGTTGCVALTIMAALLSYTARQGEIAAARQTSADAYESARRERAGAGLGMAIGLGVIFSIWACVAFVTGLFAYMTRGQGNSRS